MLYFTQLSTSNITFFIVNSSGVWNSFIFLNETCDNAAQMVYFYRPQRSCEGYVFTGVCLSTRGGYPSMPCRWYPSMPCSRSPGGACYTGVPALGGLPALGGGWWRPPPPADGYCCGWYASYWHAFLCELNLVI